MSLVVIEPLSVTDAMVVSTNVELEAEAYSATFTYGAGAQCIDMTNHKLYTSVAGGNVGNLPSSSPAAWTEQRLANRWRCLDTRASTKTVRAGSISYRIRPGQVVNSVGILNAYADSVRVRMVDPVQGTVYDKTTSLLGTLRRSSMYDFFFSRRVRKTQSISLDLPVYYGADILIDLVAASGDASVGVLMMGYQRAIGYGVQYGMGLGITDRSKEVQDAWGENELKSGAYSRRMNMTISLLNSELESVDTQLVALRSTPCLWLVPLTDSISAVFGWCGDFDILVKYATESDCNLQIKGLT